MSIRPRSIVFYSEHNLVGRKLERPWSLTLRKLASDTWNKMRIVKNVLFGHGYGYRQHCQAQKEREKDRERKKNNHKKGRGKRMVKKCAFFSECHTHFQSIRVFCIVMCRTSTNIGIHSLTNADSFGRVKQKCH